MLKTLAKNMRTMKRVKKVYVGCQEYRLDNKLSHQDSCDEVTDEGVKHLGKSLGRLNHLQSLHLNFDP